MKTEMAEVLASQHDPISSPIDQVSDRPSPYTADCYLTRPPSAVGGTSADIHTSLSEVVVWIYYYRSPSRRPQIFSDLVTEELGPGTGPYRQFITEATGRNGMAWRDRRAYERRIETLRDDAGRDDLTINVDSEQDFWDFVRSVNYLPRAMLALMDNGDIRAVWKGDDLCHLGLHFLGGGEIQYVIFKRRFDSKRVSRVAGVDTFGGIEKQIVAFDLIASMNQ